MRILNIPLVVGRRDSVDPKYAPNGVVHTAKNLRVRKDGRLTCRKGYVPAPNSIHGISSVAYITDLHEYNSRLVALTKLAADSTSDPAIDVVERSEDLNKWILGSPSDGARLNPFTGAVQVARMPLLDAAVTCVDSAAGGGYVCSLCSQGTKTILLVVDQSNDQAVAFGNLLTQNYISGRLAFSGGAFYAALVASNNQIDIWKCVPGTDSIFTKIVNSAIASSGTAVSFDFCPVQNATTAAVAIAADHLTSTDLLIKVYNSSGTQIGSTITLSTTDTRHIGLIADQTADAINLLTLEGAGGTANLRTYTFAGVATGPTALTATGTAAHLCAYVLPSNGTRHIATYVTGTSSTVFQDVLESNHSLGTDYTVPNFRAFSRIIPWNDAWSGDTIVCGGVTGPQLAASTEDLTNALVYVSMGNLSVAHMATFDYLKALSPSSLARTTLGLSVDSSTSKVCWSAAVTSAASAPVACLLNYKDTGRRDSTNYGGLLYLAGAAPQVYDGRQLTSLGFGEVPGIVSATPSNSTGTLTNSATYRYVWHWEYTYSDGSHCSSAPSSVTTVTMGASDDTVTLTVTTPHVEPIACSSNGYVSGLVGVLSRTVWDATAGAPASDIFREVSRTPISGSFTANTWGANISVVDTTPDSTLASKGAVYTQSARGPLSGTLEHNAPRACQYIASTEARLLTGGHSSSFEYQVSKEAFLGEAFSFSEFSSFFGTVTTPVVGVAARGPRRYVFTRNDIYTISGAGPDDIGGGTLDLPVRIPSPAGLLDWRSLLETPDGLWFQLQDTQLYQIQDSGTVVWAGIDVQDTLASYPVITGTARCRKDDTAVFACQNTSAGTDARLLVRSLRTGIWTEDTPPLQTNSGISALCSYGDTLAYASGGVVYLQSTGFGDGTSGATVIVTELETHPIYPFELGGYGTCHEVLLTGEYRSAGTLALRVSYDDKVSWTTLDSFTLSGLTVGQTVQRKWCLPQTDTTSVAFEWIFTPSAVGEGFIAHSAALSVDQQSGLRELNPAEQA